MKKMMKGLGVLTVAVLFFAFAGQARAFCVHNGSDRELRVHQTENMSLWGKGFSAVLSSTESACCNWQNGDCNKSGGQTDPVAFDVHYRDSYLSIAVCKDYVIPANGDLYVYIKNERYVCEQTLPPLPPMPVPPPPPVIK